VLTLREGGQGRARLALSELIIPMSELAFVTIRAASGALEGTAEFGLSTARRDVRARTLNSVLSALARRDRETERPLAACND